MKPELERDMDPALTDHQAEAAEQHAEHPAPQVPPHSDAGPGYYDLPVVKAPPWKWYIAAYFYSGGLAGASAVLHGAVKLANEKQLGALGTKLRVMALAGEVIGAGFLISDLGRPERFHHMMRVVRPTSPMNVGTWILSTAGATSALELVRHVLGKGPDRMNVLTAVNMAAGGALTAYTGVLVGNTAVPVWKTTRDVLPPMFAAASGASAASMLELIGASSRREVSLVRRFSIATKLAAVATTELATHVAGPGIVGAPLRSRMWTAARVLNVASLVATIVPGRTVARIAGILGTAAGLAQRFAILAAGRESAAEPRATLTPDL
ncbi:MAG TPA: NrfD/PsrC family molybdoenzyme membrane anchor subunit [Kofleriaceae bacterium]